jgi:hypothetical protein
VPTFDLHQHLWPESFIEELSRRASPPRLRGQTLELLDEGEFEVDLDDHRLERRFELLDEDGIDVAVVSLQPTLGIADLPEDEQEPLLTAYDDGILELIGRADGRLGAFCAGSFRDGFAGRCVSAGSLLHLDAIAPALDELERAGGVLFVHPGPAHVPPWAPAWWAAVVDYTAQMQAAYAAWVAAGAARWPNLRVVFAILAGGAPFQLERLGSREVETRQTMHPTVFFDTASYGPRALELCLGMFGVNALVYGSDRPVAPAGPTLRAIRGFGQAVEDALCSTNPARLLA